MLAVDVRNGYAPDAVTSPDRLFCHVYGRGKNQAQMIPGWPYSFVAALEPGRTSWTAILDVQRLRPADDATAVTATQLRDVVDRIIQAGHWRRGDPPILIIVDTGYDTARLAHVLADLPVQLLGRICLTGSCGYPDPPAPRAPPAGRPTRTRVPARHPGHLAYPAAPDDHRDHPLRHRASSQLGPAASAVDPPHLWDRPRRRPTHN